MPPGRISDPGGLGLRARSPPVRGAAAPTRLAPGVGGPGDDAHTMVTLAHPPRRRLRPVRWRRPARATARFLLLPLSLAARPTTGTARSSPLHPATVTASARFVAVRVVPDRTLEAAAQVMRRRLRDLPSSGTVAVADGSLRVSVQGPDCARMHPRCGCSGRRVSCGFDRSSAAPRRTCRRPAARYLRRVTSRLAHPRIATARPSSAATAGASMRRVLPSTRRSPRTRARRRPTISPIQANRSFSGQVPVGSHLATCSGRQSPRRPSCGALELSATPPCNGSS